MSDSPLLEIDQLGVEFKLGRRRPVLRAVDDVSLAVGAGETVGLVGESGSGKTTIGRAVLGLTAPSAGTIRLDGQDITHLVGRQRRRLSDQLQVVFQDPYGSLNSLRTVGSTLAEPLLGQPGVSRNDVGDLVSQALVRVGLPADAGARYPMQFSGGQRQRIAIARALMREPSLVICDEPVSALDLSVQASVLNLLEDLQESLGLAYLFIAHDLSVVRHISRRIVVLYQGQIMERGPADVIYERPSHPYTLALLAASKGGRARTKTAEKGSTSSMTTGPGGCPFRSRCPFAVDICARERPRLGPGPTGADVACHRAVELHAMRALDTQALLSGSLV